MCSEKRKAVVCVKTPLNLSEWPHEFERLSHDLFVKRSVLLGAIAGFGGDLGNRRILPKSVREAMF